MGRPAIGDRALTGAERQQLRSAIAQLIQPYPKR
jgi:hypothetical protein